MCHRLLGNNGIARGFCQAEMLSNGFRDDAFDLAGRYSRDRTGLVLSAAQGRADIEPVPDAVLAGKARAHAIAPVVEEFSLQEGATLRICRLAFDDVGLEQRLHSLKGLLVHDRLVLAFEPLAAMMDLAEIDPVLEKVREGTVGEGNAAIVFGDLCIAALSDDAPLVQVSDQAAKRFEL